MPRVSRWLIRTALLYLVAALGLGTALSAGGPGLTEAWPVYIHLFMLGWLTQLIAGVAYWMFPRASRSTPPGDPRGWAVYGLLNAGLILRALVEPGAPSHPGLAAALLPVSALLQLGAGVVFAASVWPRVRAR